MSVLRYLALAPFIACAALLVVALVINGRRRHRVYYPTAGVDSFDVAAAKPATGPVEPVMKKAD